MLCIGMTCERVLFNSELFSKVRAVRDRPGFWVQDRRIPWWVRLIANRRLIKDQRNAALSYQKGLIPENIAGIDAFCVSHQAHALLRKWNQLIFRRLIQPVWTDSTPAGKTAPYRKPLHATHPVRVIIGDF